MNNQITKTNQQLMNKNEVADLLNITIRTLDRMIASRSIPFIRLPTGSGKRERTRFKANEIDSWLKSLSEPVVRSSNEDIRKVAFDLIMGT